MLKKLAKIIAMGVLIIMSLGLFAGCGNNYSYNESDFELTIEVNKTEAHVGDTITVTARFENLSARDIPIKISPWDTREKHEIKDLIQIGLFPENTKYSFDVYDLAGRMGKKTISKNAVVRRITEFTVEEELDYEMAAAIIFYIGKNYDAVIIYSEVITIQVKGEK